MGQKLRVAILFGGKSAEHEVSLQSARTVAQALNKDAYEVVYIGVNKAGQWLAPGVSERYLALASSKPMKAPEKSREVVMMAPSGGGILTRDSGVIEGKIDVVFPLLHGPMGEDGTVQGLLKLAGVPFVGASVLGSAVGMDKDVMKRLLRDAGLPVARFLVVRAHEAAKFAEAKKKLGLPFFVKPANMGSSVGVSKVHSEQEFKDALQEAFRFDTKVLIEEYLMGREIECAVLGNEHPKASVLGELMLSENSEFYSYDAKYVSADAMQPHIPARVPKSTATKMQRMAIDAYQALCCEGMGRVDFFLTAGGDVYVNEINTIPGFTTISMYPKLWEASGVPLSELIDTLIRLALERHTKEQQILTSRADG